MSDSGVIMNAPLMERYRIWFVLFYSIVVGALVFLVIWLYRLNRHESRRRMHAQTRLLIQNRLVEQRDEFDNIFCSIRDGLITYDTDFRIHFVNRALMLMLELILILIRHVITKVRWLVPFSISIRMGRIFYRLY